MRFDQIRATFVFLFLANLFLLSQAQFTTEPTTLKPAQELKLELESHKIIPDLLKHVPPYGIQIKFLEKVTADYGNILKPDLVKFAPYLIKWPITPETYYTVMMVGLDEPTVREPTMREWIYYLIVNIPGPTVFQGEIIVPWVPPHPEADSGLHRYVFLIYQQRARTTFTDKRLDHSEGNTARAHFSQKRFAEKYHLGLPLAVNFFKLSGPFNNTVTVPSNIDEEFERAQRMREEGNYDDTQFN